MIPELHWSAFAFLTVLITLFGAVILFKEYRKYKQNTDTSFYRGLYSISIIALLFSAAYSGADMTSKAKFMQTDGYTVISFSSVKYIRDVTGINKAGCLVDDTVESQQCMFLMNAELDQDYLIPVISNSDNALVRTGKWPFASVQSFPQLTKDTLLSGM